MIHQYWKHPQKFYLVLCLIAAFAHTNVWAQQDPKIQPWNPTRKLVAPMPLTVGIDDVGWKIGWSTVPTGGPYRADMPKGRRMVWEDYEVLSYVGKAVNTRLLCLFIMCEFDRSNICADYPTTTQEGASWDNSALVSDEDFRIMNFIKDNAAHIEFGLHGVGHEHWINGKRNHAEWANQPRLDYRYKKTGVSPWPYSEVSGHMECFKKLIDQYGISFPKSFVPPQYCYYYNPSDPKDTGGLMNTWGVKYAIQLATHMNNHGLMVLPRYHEVRWHQISTAPTLFPSDYSNTCGHWPNFLEMDPKNNHVAGDKWIKWFNQINDLPDRYLPKNTAQMFSQYLYKRYADIKVGSNTVEIDATNMPEWAYDNDLLGNFLLKLPLETGTHVSKTSLNGGTIACYYEDRGFGHIVLPKLSKSHHLLTYAIGDSEMPDYVLNDGTYNVKTFAKKLTSAAVSLEMYGTQDVKVKLTGLHPTTLISRTKDLIVNTWKWDEQTKLCVINVTAKDNQGVQGTLEIKSN